ncbi:DUF2637 domain-containing protein [Streptomyces sp. CMB-StM0423]|uniref:DUF2637 domain-containing protein n=1 Tax=Streptomyces sp. CMB-StM0423 TaxID=2059884 RepID=UPI000C70222B|nr:DUF2637 domain-containing protein [Streptomyces sp. CMB-StM0423]AUH39791.1 hypothetical protein CXR04_05605 [Streptomyces sp. CMB-StM0423]
MGFNGIPLSWALPAAVLLLGVLAAIAVVVRGRQKADEPADSWEAGEQRRRRKEAMYGTLAYVLLFCCAAVAAALSFHGLVGFGRQNLGLSGGWEYLVPFGLDGAAMFCSVIAVREASNGDAALGSRLLVWTFAGAAAWFNWVHAPRGTGHAGAPQFFAGMSLSAAVLFDRALKQTRRAALREQGLVPRPLPQIRFVRWLRAPRETFHAWSLMLLEGVRTLDEAVDEVRQDSRDEARRRAEEREQARLERARLKALGKHQRALAPGELTAARAEPQVALTPEPVTEAARFPLRSRAAPESRPAVAGGQPGAPAPAKSVAAAGGQDDALAAPLDTLEQKLTAMENQYR